MYKTKENEKYKINRMLISFHDHELCIIYYIDSCISHIDIMHYCTTNGLSVTL